MELSQLGYKFLTDIFESFDKVRHMCHSVYKWECLNRSFDDDDTKKDQDGALNAEELAELFSTSPGNPWASQKFPETTVADDAGAVTLQGWLAQWRFVSTILPWNDRTLFC